MKDLHLLPKVRDSLSYLSVEHCRIDQEAKAIAIHDAEGKTPFPGASLCLLMVGPGTSITRAAIRSLAENGCPVLWTGEEGVRLYAQGLGETRSARNLLRRQAQLWSKPSTRLAVVKRMYRMRFQETFDPELSLRQIRGKEGIRVCESYASTSKETGVPWHGRAYRREGWGAAEPINRARSTANSCFYGVCHASVLSAVYSLALGFIHTGKMLPFVYDVADLYKVDITIPAAFRATAQGTEVLESRTRRMCRDAFRGEPIAAAHRAGPAFRYVPGMWRYRGR